MSCDFIKPYDKDLSMANPNSPSNAVSTGFDGLGFSFDCDSVMSLWMGKDRAISGQMSFLNKGFAEIADMVQKELTAKRNIPAGDALTKNFIPSSIEFWKQMATAAEAGKAPTEFDGYSMAELMYNEMMVSKCSAGPDYIQAILAMKDRSDDFVCNNFQDIFDPDFVAKCGSQLVALNGSPFAKKCQLSTFDASQTQQVNFKGAKGLPSTCSLAGGNQCAFQWDLTKLMRGKQATARMWMKTCPSGLPSMYMDLIGPGTASLQNPVGDYCDTNAQTNQCPSNYMCVDMENTKFLAGMAYDRERKYVKCASDSECTPFSRTRDVWVGEGEMKFDAKCDTTQGFCVWDSRGTNIDPHSRVVTQSVFEELFNGNKPVKDDSIYGLVQTIVGKTVSPPPAGKHGLCLGLDLNFEKWSEAALSMDSTTKAVTFGGMSPWDFQQAASTAAPTAKVYTGSPTEFGKTSAPTAKPPTVPPTEKAYTGSPTEFGKTGSPTTPTVQAPTKAQDETSGCSALHPGFVGLAATIVLAF